MIDPTSFGRCNICGGTAFEAGFLGRMSPNGRPPTCRGCKSVERHRIIYDVYSHLRPFLKERRGLQFAPEGIFRPEWFKAFDFSAYGRHNSYDMMDIPLPEGAFDIVISNHVIEHVADDAKALSECLRVVGEKGVVHVNAPSPCDHYSTRDWGFADPAKNQHYRDYGADMGRELCRRTPGVHGVGVIGHDPATMAIDTIFFFSRSEATLGEIALPLQRALIGCIVVA